MRLAFSIASVVLLSILWKFLFDDQLDIPHQFPRGIDFHQDRSCGMAYILRDVRSPESIRTCVWGETFFLTCSAAAPDISRAS